MEKYFKKGIKKCEIKEINNFEEFEYIFNEYKSYAQKLGFKAISERKCKQWFKNMRNEKGLCSLKVFQASESKNYKNKLGYIGILEFKQKSFYLFGFTNNLGRKYQANSALLWRAILQSKNNNFLNLTWED